jgi:FAD/FMN-containing dehydrogenase
MTDRDAHIAIMVAAAKGTGLRLSADEVAALANDEAISTAALNGIDEIDWPNHAVRFGPGPDWARIKRHRDGRQGRNFAV